MPSKITMHKISCTVAAGATSASATSGVMRGKVLAIKTVLNNTTPASSSDRDINLYDMNPFDDDDVTDAVQEILDIGGVGAAPADDNAVYYPRTPSQDYQGTDVTFDGTNEIYEPFLVFGKLFLNVTSAAAGDITTLYVLVEEY
jgi:hypothetical protein